MALLSKKFPSIPVVSEESKHDPQLGVHFVVDPLDGTNNFAVGLPCYAVTIALVKNRTPIGTAVTQGQTGHHFVTKNHNKDGAATIHLNGKEWKTSPLSSSSPTHIRSALWLGYETYNAQDVVERTRRRLSHLSSRVFENWSPASDLFVALSGELHLVAGVQCGGKEIPAAIATFKAMGWKVVTTENEPVKDITDSFSFIAGTPNCVTKYFQTLNEEECTQPHR